MKKIIIILGLVSLWACNIKHKATEAKFDGRATVRGKLGSTLVPDSTGLSMLFDDVNHTLIDKGGFERDYVFEIGLTAGTTDSLHIQNDWRYYIKKDTGSLVEVTIRHGSWSQQWKYGREVALDSNFNARFVEHGPFPAGALQYDVKITLTNFHAQGLSKFVLDSWDMTRIR